MRVGISLAGVSYTTSGKQRDFRKTSESFFKTLCTPLSASVYTTTYPHELEAELLATYNPVKHQFIPFKGSHPRSTLMHGLCLVEEEPLDFLVVTRFDLKFNQKITDMNLDFTKFNFIFKEEAMWDSHKFVSDTFFAFPMKHFYGFADALEKLSYSGQHYPHTFMHHIYDFVVKEIGEENVHFICGDEKAFSHQNRFFDLVRTEV